MAQLKLETFIESSFLGRGVHPRKTLDVHGGHKTLLSSFANDAPCAALPRALVARMRSCRPKACCLEKTKQREGKKKVHYHREEKAGNKATRREKAKSQEANSKAAEDWRDVRDSAVASRAATGGKSQKKRKTCSCA